METACPGFLSLLLRWNTVTVRVSRALLEHDRKQLGEKRIHFSLQFHNTTQHIIKRPQGRNHSRLSRGTLLTGLFSAACTACITYTCQEPLLRCGTVHTGRGPPTASAVKKTPPTDMLTGQSGQATPQLGLPLLHNSSLCQVDKLKSTLPYSAQLKAAVALKNKALGSQGRPCPV